MKPGTSPFLLILAVSAALSTANCQIPGWEFDSRVQWAHCPTVSEIRDRGDCDSSWAFAAAETMSDRSCIHNWGGRRSSRYSVEDLISCCGSSCGSTSRCSGGTPADAWTYWLNEGIVSEDCKPYNTSDSCQKTCREGYPLSYEEDKHFGRSFFRFPNDTVQIQLEIMRNGPVATTVRIYDDFDNYRGGVYRRTSNVAVGYESARIIGWGWDRGANWLLASSRGYDWGEKGTFRIAREIDEGGIESSVITGKE